MIQFWSIAILHGDLTKFAGVIRRALAFISRTALASIHAGKMANNWNKSRKKSLVNDFNCNYNQYYLTTCHTTVKEERKKAETFIHPTVEERLSVWHTLIALWKSNFPSPPSAPSAWSTSSFHEKHSKNILLSEVPLFHYAFKQDSEGILCLAAPLLYRYFYSVSLPFLLPWTS